MPIGEIFESIARGLKNVGREAASGETREIPEFLQRQRITDRLSAHDIMGAKDDLFRTGGQNGIEVGNMFKQYQLKRAQVQQQLQTPLKAVSDGIMEHPTLSKEVRTDTKLGDIHAKLRAEKNPLAQITSKLGGPDGSGFSKTLEQHSIDTISKARMIASAQVFGPKMQNLTPFLIDAFDSQEPTQVSWAHAVMNVISNETHDTTSVTNPLLGTSQEVSGVKSDVQRAFKRINVLREKTGSPKPLLPQTKFDAEGNLISKGLDVSPTRSKAGLMEHRVNNVLRAVQLPFVFLKHISQVGNLSSIPAPNLVHGLLNMSDAEFRTHLDASAILAYTQHDMMDKQIRGRFGQISKWTQNATAGELFYRSYHMPFFDYVRTQQLTLAASVGYHSANVWAKQALEGNRRALLELEEMGLNIDDVKKQGGILTDQQKIYAMYHFTNNRLFMDKTIERSLYSSNNFFMRSATMYHTFINAQQRFMRRELSKMYKAGDFVGIAQFAGTLGVLFPSVMPFQKSLEVFGRTFSPDKAGQSAKDDYDKLINGSFGDRTSTYLDLLAHTGALGIYNSYIGAAKTDRFAYQLMGPNIAVGARFVGDLIKSAAVTNQAGKHNLAPPVRDLFEDTLPIIGTPLAHKFAPTQKEAKEAAGYPQRSSRPHRTSRRAIRNFWEF